MKAGNSHSLGRVNAGFALAAAITVLFNTGLAWAKDAYPPLNTFMASLMGHHWTTHAAADLLLFFGLGLILSKTGAAQKIGPNRLIGGLVGAVIVGSLGLLGWYLVF